MGAKRAAALLCVVGALALNAFAAAAPAQAAPLRTVTPDASAGPSPTAPNAPDGADAPDVVGADGADSPDSPDISLSGRSGAAGREGADGADGADGTNGVNGPRIFGVLALLGGGALAASAMLRRRVA